MSTFNALNGAETLEVILAKIRTALINTGEFRPHLTFPLMKFDFEVKVWNYPKQSLNSDAGIKATGSEGERAEDTNASEPSLTVNSVEVVDTPDKERKAVGLEIPVAQSAAHGILVDQRLDQPQASPSQPSVAIPVPAPASKAESIQAAVATALASPKGKK